MIDANGFRANVGIVLVNEAKQVFWGKRPGQEAWQFPQGGIHENESVEEALYRELTEEIGVTQQSVAILGRTRGWLYYRLPKRLVRMDANPVCIGQKQKWFLLQLTDPKFSFRFDLGDKPEFDGWKWVSYWYPLKHVVPFKREVYRRALKELAPVMFASKDRFPNLDPFRV